MEVLFARLRTPLHAERAPCIVGLSGLQGSGKSTFAAQLVALARSRGVAAEVVSLDDFYLGRRERQRLARQVHPLLATRGVPGTHDIGLLDRTLADLERATRRDPARMPRFDKGRDTRLPPSRWRRVSRAPRLIVLEGWCIGVPPQWQDDLRRPLNALERNEDTQGLWRRWVNAHLAGAYARLWTRLEALVVLQAPGIAIVARWRGEQERCLRARQAPQAMHTVALARFLMHYERLSRHALRTLPARADLRIILRPNRSVAALVHGSGSA